MLEQGSTREARVSIRLILQFMGMGNNSQVGPLVRGGSARVQVTSVPECFTAGPSDFEDGASGDSANHDQPNECECAE